MKYLYAVGFSLFLLLGMMSPTITHNFGQKFLYNKEIPKEKKKKEYRLNLILWVILTVAVFVFFVFFVD